MRAFYRCTLCILVIDAEKIDRLWSTYTLSRRSKWRHWTRSTRRSSASVRRLHESMLNARSLSASSVNWRQPSVCLRVTARACSQERWPQPGCRPRERRRLGAGAVRLQNRLAAAIRRASTIRFLPWRPARRSKKLPLHARALARTMSAPRLPGTSGPAASKSAMGSSMPHSRLERSNASQSEDKNRASADSERSRPMYLRLYGAVWIGHPRLRRTRYHQMSSERRERLTGPMARTHFPPPRVNKLLKGAKVAD